MTRPASEWFSEGEDWDDLVEPGDEEREDRLKRSLMGSKFGWMSTAGLGTVDVGSIQRGRISAFPSE